MAWFIIYFQKKKRDSAMKRTAFYVLHLMRNKTTHYSMLSKAFFSFHSNYVAPYGSPSLPRGHDCVLQRTILVVSVNAVRVLRFMHRSVKRSIEQLRKLDVILKLRLRIFWHLQN